ncbi:hypothetical protein [Vibrio sp. D431a]|uniref:hypothetical protein n=1 Tax=Vibrio sp. D431a TaxID=2837388 RepID=UPI002556C215|nr:hypothetical protein [Vibrio sp. D431a]MDK9790104.1 hypothetical protein [Vibrio sp. D431a]
MISNPFHAEKAEPLIELTVSLSRSRGGDDVEFLLKSFIATVIPPLCFLRDTGGRDFVVRDLVTFCNRKAWNQLMADERLRDSDRHLLDLHNSICSKKGVSSESRFVLFDDGYSDLLFVVGLIEDVYSRI